MARNTTNRIRDLRTKKDLTQKALADLVGTSQQQIQRIETGLQSARLDIARAICQVLGAPLDTVFPGTKDLKSHHIEDGWATRDHEAIAKAHKSGLDIDIFAHTLKIHLVGGFEGFFPIQSNDKDRIESWLQRSDSGRIEFYSRDKWILLNQDHLLTAQLLWDSPWTLGPEEEEDDAPLSVRVWFNDRPEPFEYLVDQDISDEMLEDRYELKDLALYAIADVDTMLHFEDSDGEQVFLRRENISLLTISLAALYPSLINLEEEG